MRIAGPWNRGNLTHQFSRSTRRLVSLGIRDEGWACSDTYDRADPSCDGHGFPRWILHRPNRACTARSRSCRCLGGTSPGHFRSRRPQHDDPCIPSISHIRTTNRSREFSPSISTRSPIATGTSAWRYLLTRPVCGYMHATRLLCGLVRPDPGIPFSQAGREIFSGELP